MPSHWSSEGETPVQVEVTARDDRQKTQKIYLARATLRFAVADQGSALTGPDPLVDSANITPGYLVTGPYAYVQSFSVPPVDPAATTLTIYVKLEFVSLVDKKNRDYTKRTVIDTVITGVNP